MDDVRFASDALTCVCVLGGEWNGIPVQGIEYVYDTEQGVVRTFEDFVEAFKWVIDEYPYITNDKISRMGPKLTNSDSRSDDSYVELFRMRMPDRSALRVWYDEHVKELREDV